MSKQSNKAEKRKRRQAYLKRRRNRGKTKAATSAVPHEPKVDTATVA